MYLKKHACERPGSLGSVEGDPSTVIPSANSHVRADGRNGRIFISEVDTRAFRSGEGLSLFLSVGVYASEDLPLFAYYSVHDEVAPACVVQRRGKLMKRSDVASRSSAPLCESSRAREAPVDAYRGNVYRGTTDCTSLITALNIRRPFVF